MKDPHEKGTVMKLTREEFQKYIYAYNEDEIFYKTLYLQEKEHPETFHEYCLTLDRELIYEHRLFVPELQAEAWYPYMKEADLFHDMNGISYFPSITVIRLFFPMSTSFLRFSVFMTELPTLPFRGSNTLYIPGISVSSHHILPTVWESLMTVLLLIFWYVVPPFSPLSSSH